MIKNKFKKLLLKSEGMLFIIFLITFFGVGLFNPEKFLTINNLTSMAFQIPELGLLALAMMAIILTGGINLSIAATATFSSIIGALFLRSDFAKANPIISILITVIIIMLVSLVAGIINGFFVAYVGVTAMLATLGTMTLFEGIGLNITKGGAVSGFPLEFIAIGNKIFLGIPIPMMIYIIVCIFSYFLLERSAFGIKVHMLGSNSVASEFSGINVKWEIFKIYLYSAIMSGIAGIIMMSRYNSAKTDYGSSYLMQAITVVVLGGTSITGGHGTVLGTVISVLIIQVVSTGLNIIGINRNIVDIVIGGLLILVLIVKYFIKKYKNE
ncbi:ABC transporter permease [Oceanivirga salmonicida]|uniref:ABC transporter permease n=1 Tax=Oceanivirga salmonicida TaxID=1769291 RepID=UPI00082E9B30|nr:ABC transporter permease [Oceanivirga salmonicida]